MVPVYVVTLLFTVTFVHFTRFTRLLLLLPTLHVTGCSFPHGLLIPRYSFVIWLRFDSLRFCTRLLPFGLFGWLVTLRLRLLRYAFGFHLRLFGCVCLITRFVSLRLLVYVGLVTGSFTLSPFVRLRLRWLLVTALLHWLLRFTPRLYVATVWFGWLRLRLRLILYVYTVWLYVYPFTRCVCTVILFTLILFGCCVTFVTFGWFTLHHYVYSYICCYLRSGYVILFTVTVWFPHGYRLRLRCCYVAFTGWLLLRLRLHTLVVVATIHVYVYILGWLRYGYTLRCWLFTVCLIWLVVCYITF